MAVSYSLPHNFEPRWYQKEVFNALAKGYKRIIIIWPRRAGKDLTCTNLLFSQMFVNIGAYYYMFPEYAQGRRILWDGIHDGKRFVDHMPAPLRSRVTTQNMGIHSVNGSTFHVIGADNIDSVVGTNPLGIVFSEWSLMNPRAWDYMRPILAQNEGWAIFNYTPRGDNHGKDMYEAHKDDPNWFVLKLTVDDIGHINPIVLEQERQEIIRLHGSDALFQQEYYTSFDSPVIGAYYGDLMSQLVVDKRIRSVPHDPALPVHTSWDLGYNDATAIWFVQLDPFGDWRFINYYESTKKDMSYYGKVIQEIGHKEGYIYGEHYLPHDGKAQKIETGKSSVDILRPLVAGEIRVVPVIRRKQDRISLVRSVLPKCWIDEIKCKQGISCLKNYRNEYDDKRKTYRNDPYHDWASHGADAFGQIIQFYRQGGGASSMTFDMDHDPYRQ